MKLLMQCQSTFADDLDNPGIDFIEIDLTDDEGNARSIPLLLFEFKAAKRFKAAAARKPLALTKRTFKSPQKVKGVHGKTADYAKLLQKMMDDGMDINAISKKLKRGRDGTDGDDAAMDEDGATIDA